MTCCAVLLEPQLLDIMIVQFRNEKVSNHGSIPITVDCNVVAFIVFEEGFHQPIKRTKQYTKVESERLNYIRYNQLKLRAEEYIHLRDTSTNDKEAVDIGKRHCRFRYQWCQARAHWRTEWRSFVFADERWLCLGASDGSVLVRRRSGEHRQPNCLRPRHTGPTSGVIV
ncbi:transposable element Tc1 transposase [Trichonephila clavipes]|nr:transposable element Tc1 transposase [Trichonephila clavipes]